MAATPARPDVHDGTQASGSGGDRKAGAAPAVTRAAAALAVLSHSPEPLGLNQIARALDILPSSCLHILRSLVAGELAAFDPLTKRYTLGVGILTLARRMLRKHSLADALQPVLDTVAAAHGVTSVAVQLSGLRHMVAVAVSYADVGVRLHVDIGSRFPALISATGRLVAAFGGHPQGEVERRFSMLRWHRAPPLTAWRKQVQAARRQGYAVDEGHYIPGVTIVSAPIFHPGEALSHALIGIGVREQLKGPRVRALGHDLREHARRVSQVLNAQ